MPGFNQYLTFLRLDGSRLLFCRDGMIHPETTLP